MPVDLLPSGLPVDVLLPELLRVLQERGAAVVRASPGAGKTTIVPLALLGAPWLGDRRLIMLEPRRLAARAAAHRMAFLRGEQVGRVVGYRTRLDSRVSAATRIEVVTEGILTRIIQDDPTLEMYGGVLFDEFHERSLNADVGLGLTLQTRRLIRPDLRIVVMSATIDGTAVARLLDDAPVIGADGRMFDVETRYRPVAGTPGPALQPARLAPAMASTIAQALATEPGDVLAFLPGAPEIHRVMQALEAVSLPANADVLPLHGTMRPEDQDRAIAASPASRRKVVLATSIAETSLTIEGVRIVVDAGLSRRPRFSPRTGMSRLETLRVSRASADQRRGRAGRTAPGVCYRLWDEHEDAALLAFAPPEILEADLAPVVLDLAVAGTQDPGDLAWLDAPPAAAWNQARELLQQLQAIDGRGHATPHGTTMASLGMHPRLAHMVLRAVDAGQGPVACDLAALLGERDPFIRTGSVSHGVDLRDRLDAVHDRRDRNRLADDAVLRRIREQARRLRERLKVADTMPETDHVGQVLALAYPDRVAQRRPSAAPRFLLRNGTGAVLPDGDPLATSPYLVVAESDGRVPESRVFLAASLTLDAIELDFRDQVVEIEDVTWDDELGIRARRERRLGALVLSSRRVDSPDPELVGRAVAKAIRRRGLDVLAWSDRATGLRQRLAFLHRHDATWPDMSDAALVEALLDGLQPQLATVRSAESLRRIDVHGALLGRLSRDQRAALERLAPVQFVAPTGTRVTIDYANPDAPVAAVRLQEMFGCSVTPAVLDGRVPLTLQLLSPAQRPVQVTRDLAGFWRTSYFDVRKDLRARYPKHPWPDDPASAQPTNRARRRS